MRDVLNNPNPDVAANAAMSVITALQDYPKGTQLAALAAAFVLFTELSGIYPGDVLTAATNMMVENTNRRPEFLAVKEYIRNEILNAS